MPEPGALIGLTIGQRYHLVRALGWGGVGEVYKAVDPVLHRAVAVKLLRSDRSLKPERIARLRTEARWAAKIGHPNIVDVLDFGDDSARPYIVMEYIRGSTLQALIREDAPLEIDRAAHIVTHILNGLDAAHKHEIVHRDLKPSNVLITTHLNDSDFAKVCDFGFAALLSRPEGRRHTPADGAVGTPAYMAPEALRGSVSSDPRLDVYSVGVILYELLSGVRPFSGKTFGEFVERVLRSEAPRLGLYARVPGAVEELVRRALARDPRDRFASAGELAAALAPFGGTYSPSDDPSSDTLTRDLRAIRARLNAKRRADAPAARRDTMRVPWTVPPWEEQVLPRLGPQARLLTMPMEPSPLRQRDTVQSIPAAKDEPAPQPEYVGRIATRVVKRVLTRLREIHGEAPVSSIVANLPDSARHVLGSHTLDWIPYTHFLGLLELVDVGLGGDDLQIVAACGREAAELHGREMDRYRKDASDLAEVFLSEIPGLAAPLFDHARLRLKSFGRGYARVRIEDRGPPALRGSVFVLGYLERLLQLFGAIDVEVNLTACVSLGDEATDIDITWLP